MMVREEIAAGRAQASGLIDSLKGIARTSVEIVHSRLELLVTELSEEQSRLIELVLVAGLALLTLFLGIVFAAFLVVAAFWDTPYRLWAPGILAVVLVVGAGVLWAVFMKKAKAKGKAFAATLHELATDVEHLR
jgi:uncharacterized membrane protein YqjE